MLNEDRIILMTKMASYEKREGKDNKAVSSYFRSDYIAVQLLKSALYATFAFLLCFGLYVLYHLDELLENINHMDMGAFARNMLTYYGISLLAYSALTYVACTVRYVKVRRKQKRYGQQLKKLYSMYDR